MIGGPQVGKMLDACFTMQKLGLVACYCFLVALPKPSGYDLYNVLRVTIVQATIFIMTVNENLFICLSVGFVIITRNQLLIFLNQLLLITFNLNH